jgi:hypothetical protein
MKLVRITSKGTFAPIRRATVLTDGAKERSNFPVMNLMPGSPFGGSDWVKQDPDPKRIKKK